MRKRFDDLQASNDADCVTLDAAGLARRWNCSTKHIWRLVDAGKIPTPMRLGRLIRWPNRVIEEFELGGQHANGRQRGGKR